MHDYILLGLAGFAAGMLNSIAGGGTFITLPALIYVGIPPIVANATATLAVLPGYMSSAWAFRHDAKAEGALSLWAIAIIASIGSAIGALLLIITPGDSFLWIVPWLLLIATVLFAFGPAITKFVQSKTSGGIGAIGSTIAILIISIYGGYFNGGLGIMLLATFSILGFTSLHGMNGLKNALSALMSIVSVIAYAAAGLIAWEPAIVMAICATAGGYIGATQARKIVRTDLLRIFITLIGLTMTIIFFWRQFA